MNEKTPTLAIIALILAIIMPPIGLILGIVALNKIKKTEEKQGKTLAIIAIIIGILLTLPLLLVIFGSMMYFGALSPPTLMP